VRRFIIGAKFITAHRMFNFDIKTNVILTILRKKNVHFECVRGFMDGVRTSQHRSASDQISEIAAVLVHVCKLFQSVCCFRPTSWIYEAGIKIHAESVIGICYTSKLISTIS